MALALNDLPLAVTRTSEAILFSVEGVSGLVVILPFMLRLSAALTFLAFAPLVLVLVASLLLHKKLRTRFDTSRAGVDALVMPRPEADASRRSADRPRC